MSGDREVSGAGRRAMSDDERQELAERLDRELDEYMTSLGKHGKHEYTEGWPEDRWQEEMEKHPFFMSSAPGENEPLSPLMEGLQQLKYDESENSPEELAEAYKMDGNFHFKIRKYWLAIVAYTEGLRRKCSDDSLNAQLYNNRAAAHFFLKNYRSCLGDCRSALRLSPGYMKAKIRAAQCCLKLKMFDECTQLCGEILEAQPDCKDIQHLKKKAIIDKRHEERDQRKQEWLHSKADEVDQMILRKIKDRGIMLNNNKLPENVSEGRVHLVDDSLVWPVVFLYPEHKTSDFIVSFHEDDTFLEHLEQMFGDHPEWDVDRKYAVDKLRLYWEDRKTAKLHSVPLASSLRTVLSHSKYIVEDCKPAFLVFVDGSPAQNAYLNAHSTAR
ncbi:tetratricopeptide repeat protein 4 [Bacillus rossius redtenbacheri]|uniref:tetratricopeptide repeat protein 4 n=1 Tax=Bacillus rossius redtenbacheri TaxID=93214 RepID=UPI002FDD5164